MTQTHNCGICAGQREHNGKYCLGCATPIVQCVPKPSRRSLDCPGCRYGGPFRRLEAGRVRCLKCCAVFEGPDFGFLDDRPSVNAEKMERAEAAKRRGAYGR